jgi:uncharacterized membrane protein YidH (DUF202 family)
LAETHYALADLEQRMEQAFEREFLSWQCTGSSLV